MFCTNINKNFITFYDAEMETQNLRVLIFFFCNSDIVPVAALTCFTKGFNIYVHSAHIRFGVDFCEIFFPFIFSFL